VICVLHVKLVRLRYALFAAEQTLNPGSVILLSQATESWSPGLLMREWDRLGQTGSLHCQEDSKDDYIHHEWPQAFDKGDRARDYSGDREESGRAIPRARWQLRTLPERFRCLESADPKMQLQAALTQIEDLLQRNRKLLETVLLLSQALDDTYSINSAEHGAVYPTRRPLSSWKSTMMTAITIRR